jgi:hypothetical protein
MTAAHLAPWPWRARREPGPPTAALAWGAAAGRLHARLAEEVAGPPGAGHRRAPHEGRDGLAPDRGALAATGGHQFLVVLGEAAALPWVEGVAYAAPCAQEPALWLPMLWEPELPADLVARALQRRHGRQPLLLWHEPLAVVPLDRQLPVTPELLARLAQAMA